MLEPATKPGSKCLTKTRQPTGIVDVCRFLAVVREPVKVDGGVVYHHAALRPADLGPLYRMPIRAVHVIGACQMPKRA